MAEQNILEALGRPYYPPEVVLLIDGQRIMMWQSFTIERINPIHSWATPSADGGHLHFKHADLQGRLTLELSQKSPSLEFIKSLATRTEPFPIAVKDKSGTPDLATFTEAALETEPQFQRSTTGDNFYRCSFIGVLHRSEGSVPNA